MRCLYLFFWCVALFSRRKLGHSIDFQHFNNSLAATAALRPFFFPAFLFRFLSMLFNCAKMKNKMKWHAIKSNRENVHNIAAMATASATPSAAAVATLVSIQMRRDMLWRQRSNNNKIIQNGLMHGNDRWIHNGSEHYVYIGIAVSRAFGFTK